MISAAGSSSPSDGRLLVTLLSVILTLTLVVGGEVEDVYRPQYCGLARNTDASLYFVPFIFAETDKMAPVNLTGKWKLNRSENFDDFLKEMDMGYLARKIANQITPTHEIEQDDNSFVIKINTPRGTQVMTFKIGEQFDQKVMAYQGDFKCLASWEGSLLVIQYSPEDHKKKPVRETREITDEEYILTIYIGEVVCKRIFRRKT